MGAKGKGGSAPKAQGESESSLGRRHRVRPLCNLMSPSPPDPQDPPGSPAHWVASLVFILRNVTPTSESLPPREDAIIVQAAMTCMSLNICMVNK